MDFFDWTLAGGRSKNSNQNSFRIPHSGSSQNNSTKNPSRFPSWVPLKLSNQKSFHITQLGSIQKFPRKPPCLDLISHPITTEAKFHHNTRAIHLLQKYTQRTAFQTPNLTYIPLSHQHYLQLPHPYSISHMGYTRPICQPHGSHCTPYQC